MAGNIVDDTVLASIEYAVLHLATRFVMVLGHEKCGAVEAALIATNPEGHLKTLVDAIRPALPVPASGTLRERLDAAVRANVKSVARKVRSSEPVLASKVGQGSLEVVGGIYALESGKVDVIKA